MQGASKIQALQPLMGTWEVTIKTFNEGSGSAQAQPAATVQGTATRNWLFEGKILQENVRTTGTRTAAAGSSDDDDDALGYTSPEDREQDTPSRPGENPSPSPRTTPGQTPGGATAGGQGFAGHGMFGFDKQTGQFEHVWCDNTDSRLTLSLGNYDESSKTFTFNVRGAGAGSATTPRPSTPGSTPGATPGGAGGMDDEDDTPARPGQPSTPGGAKPGAAGGASNPMNVDMTGVDKVVLRIMGDDRHVVEYFKSGQNKVMEITYNKSR